MKDINKPSSPLDKSNIGHVSETVMEVKVRTGLKGLKVIIY